MDEAEAEVCREVHRELVKELLRLPEVDRDLVTAHVAMAVARGDSFAQVPEAEEVRFLCFGPKPLTIPELALMFRHLRRVQVGANEYEAKQGMTFLTDDDSRTSRVLLPLVGRLSQAQLKALQARAAQVQRPKASDGPDASEAKRKARDAATEAAIEAALTASEAESDAALTAAIDRAAAAAATSAPPARAATGSSPPPLAATSPVPASPPLPPHPLQAMLELTADRLIAAGVAHHPLTIAAGTSAPMVTLSAAGHIFFAGDHPKLRAIAAACLANTAWHREAIDALVAHLTCLLRDASGEGWLAVSDAIEQRALGRLLGVPLYNVGAAPSE